MVVVTQYINKLHLDNSQRQMMIRYYQQNSWWWWGGSLFIEI
jgi:hypothetical protein